MKKIFLFFALTFTCVFSYGQADRELLRLAVSFANIQLPIEDGFVTTERIELLEDELAVHITIDEKVAPVDEFVSAFNKNKSFAISMAFNDGDGFVTLLKEYRLGFRYVVTGSISGKVVELPLSSEEIASSCSMPTDTAAALEMFIMESAEQLPMDVGMGMQITEIGVEDDYMIYKIKVDESIVTLSLLEIMETEYVNGMVSYMRSTADPAEKALYKCLVDGNMGIKYIFKSSSSTKTLTMIVTPEMLK